MEANGKRFIASSPCRTLGMMEVSRDRRRESATMGLPRGPR